MYVPFRGIFDRALLVILTARKIIQSTLVGILSKATFYSYHFSAGIIVPEPHAGSNSKAKVHPNLKNLSLRPLQVVR